MSRDAMRDAFIAGWNACDGTDMDAVKRAAFDQWYQNALNYLDRTAAPLTPSDKKRQGLICSCGGTDDYCPCQNVRLK